MKIQLFTIILIIKTFLLSQYGIEANSRGTSTCTADNHCAKYEGGEGSDSLVCRTVNGENKCIPSGYKKGKVVMG